MMSDFFSGEGVKNDPQKLGDHSLMFPKLKKKEKKLFNLHELHNYAKRNIEWA